MRCLNEYLAREANKEDGCKGRFWEGRFKSQALLDEAALLTCMAYVDLNPIRAEMAETPEGSDYTSIQERIEQMAGSDTRKQPISLMPFRSQGQNPDRALPYILHDYLDLVDWSGRAVRSDKKGSISSDIPPILERLEIDPDEWLKTMRWNNRFYRALGRLEAMKAFAQAMGRQWVQGLFTCRRLYRTGVNYGREISYDNQIILDLQNDGTMHDAATAHFGKAPGKSYWEVWDKEAGQFFPVDGREVEAGVNTRLIVEGHGASPRGGNPETGLVVSGRRKNDF